MPGRVNPAPDKGETKATDATTQFGLSFLTHMSSNANENLVISPLSLQSAFSMVLLGATDDSSTQQELVEVLGYSQAAAGESLSGANRLHPHQSLRQIFDSIMASTQVAGDATTQAEFRLSNLLLTSKTLIELNANYQQELEEFYEAKVEGFPSGSSQPLHDRVNEWVSTKTNGMIKELVKESDVSDPLLLAIVLNAVYFKGGWRHKFSKENTREQHFYNADGSQSEVPFMRQTSVFDYATFGADMDDGRELSSDCPLSKLSFSVLSLPFSPNSGKDLSMVLLLPRDRDGIEKLQQALGVQALNRIYMSLVGTKVKVELPKFTLECSHDGQGTMKKMGLVRVFGSAQLDRMISENSEAVKRGLGVKVDKVIHKAKIIVDEVGAEAAAATAVTMCGITCVRAPPPQPMFIADHPFLFIIRHHNSNMPLFMGRLSSMQSS